MPDPERRCSGPGKHTNIRNGRNIIFRIISKRVDDFARIQGAKDSSEMLKNYKRSEN